MNEPGKPGKPKSPCIRLCRLDQNDICVGCKRTRDEIGNWSSMSDRQREQVMDRLQRPE